MKKCFRCNVLIYDAFNGNPIRNCLPCFFFFFSFFFLNHGNFLSDVLVTHTLQRSKQIIDKKALSTDLILVLC